MSIGAPYRHDVDVATHATMAGHVTLTMEDADEIHADGDGARNITLPAAAMGAKVVIVNTGGEVLSVKNPDASANEEIATAEVGTFFANGTVWSGVTAIHGS